jgi:hypothetical protein
MATTLPTASVNANALRRFTTTDPSRAEIFSNPEKLKSAFADAAKKAYNRSPDSDWGVNGGNEARVYEDALRKIYGISDYTPPYYRKAE